MLSNNALLLPCGGAFILGKLFLRGEQIMKDDYEKHCSRCGEIIDSADMKYAKQGEDFYLCPDCRAEWEKIEKE